MNDYYKKYTEEQLAFKKILTEVVANKFKKDEEIKYSGLRDKVEDLVARAVEKHFTPDKINAYLSEFISDEQNIHKIVKGVVSYLKESYPLLGKLLR